MSVLTNHSLFHMVHFWIFYLKQPWFQADSFVSSLRSLCVLVSHNANLQNFTRCYPGWWFVDETIKYLKFYRQQAFIFGPANRKFCHSFLTCREKICWRSKMSRFHINLNCNDCLWDTMVFPGKWFCWEYLCIICSIFVMLTNNYFS